MKTTIAKGPQTQKDWYIIDAENQILGRLATQIAKILQGKHKPTYTPFIDTGDFVVVINADKVRVTGNKSEQIKYYYHTGYMRGLVETSFQKMLATKPEKIIEFTVRKMLPKNNHLGRHMLKKLKVYVGTEHPHSAQQPKAINPVKPRKNTEK